MITDEALCIGQVQELTASGKIIEWNLEIVATISRQAPIGVQAALATAQLARASREAVAKARPLPDFMLIMESEDLKEGV